MHNVIRHTQWNAHCVCCLKAGEGAIIPPWCIGESFPKLDYHSPGFSGEYMFWLECKARRSAFNSLRFILKGIVILFFLSCITELILNNFSDPRSTFPLHITAGTMLSNWILFRQSSLDAFGSQKPLHLTHLAHNAEIKWEQFESSQHAQRPFISGTKQRKFNYVSIIEEWLMLHFRVVGVQGKNFPSLALKTRSGLWCFQYARVSFIAKLLFVSSFLLRKSFCH